VFDTDGLSELCGNGSAVDELQTTLTGLSIWYWRKWHFR